VSNKPLISNYADAAAVFAKARKPERGKPLDHLFRLMREKNGNGDIYHLYWGSPQKLMASIHPDDTVEIYTPKRIPEYVFKKILPTTIPFRAVPPRGSYKPSVEHINTVVVHGTTSRYYFKHKHYPGIRFNMITGECVSIEPPPPAVNKDNRKEWLRDLRVFKEQFELRAKLGVVDGVIREVGEGHDIPRWAMRIDWGAPSALAILFNDIKRGVPSTELLRLIVRSVFGTIHGAPTTDTAKHVFKRVLTNQSTNLRKMYGVFDETETNQ
jgi:hypothetical protein